MRKLIALFCLLVPTLGVAAPSSNKPPLRIQEDDALPFCYPWRLDVPAGTLTCNSDGTADLNIVGSGGSSVSALEVLSGVIRSSPTATIKFNPNDFAASISGTTFYVLLNPATTNFIHNQTSLQTATFKVSSGSITTDFVTNSGAALSVDAVTSNVNAGAITAVKGTALSGHLGNNYGGYFRGSSGLDAYGIYTEASGGTHNYALYAASGTVHVASAEGIVSRYGITAGTLTLSNTTGGTQCLHANTSGLVTGTGVDCGSGGGGGLGGYNLEPATVTIQAPFGILASTIAVSTVTVSGQIILNGNEGASLFGSSTSVTFGTNAFTVFSASGTSGAIQVNIYGTPAGAPQTNFGAITTSNLGPQAATHIVVMDSATETQQGYGLIDIRENATGHNDPLVWFHNLSSNSAPFIRVDDPQWDMEGVNTSTDSAHGLGKWEMFASPNLASRMQIGNSRCWDNSGFEQQFYMEPLSKGGGLYLLPADTTGCDAGAGYIASSQTVALNWFGLNGNSFGYRGPPNPPVSTTFQFPSTYQNGGQVLYQATSGVPRNWEFTVGGTTGNVLSFSDTTSAPYWTPNLGLPSGASFTHQYKNTSGGFTASVLSEDTTNGGVVVTTTGGVHLAEAAANGSSYVGFRSSDSLSGSTLWILPDVDGSAGDILTTAGNVGGNHNLYWTTPTNGSAGGTRSIQYKSGAGFGGSGKLIVTSNDDLEMQTTAQLRLFQADNVSYVGFVAPASGLTGSTVWKLPLTSGATGQVLADGGSGDSHQLFWTTPSGGSSVYAASSTAQFPFGITASTVSISSNTVLNGATFYQNAPIRMGGNLGTTGALFINGGNSSATGASNVMIGVNNSFPGANLTNGNGNVCIGALTCQNIWTDTGITAVGTNAAKVSSGTSNVTAYGSGALFANTTGTSNTGIGKNTLIRLITGTQNTALGDGACDNNTLTSSTTASGQICIGAGSYADQSNVMAIGGQGVTGAITGSITDVYMNSRSQLGNAVGLPITFHAQASSGTNRAGGDFTIASGEGTGTGTGSKVVIRVSSTSTTSGTLENVLVTVASFTFTNGMGLLNNMHFNVTGSTQPTLTSCGTGPTVIGTDTAFTITGGTGSTGCTATFTRPFTNTPTCIVSNQSMSVVNAMTYTVSATALTISETGLGTSKIDVVCVGHD